MAIAIFGPGLLALLAWAAATDVRCRRIPNAACAGIALLWLADLAVAGDATAAATALAGSLGVLAAGFAAWRFGRLGGGDVKLASALALGAGGPLLAPFLLVIALAGGALALVWLALRHARWLVAPLLVGTIGRLWPAAAWAEPGDDLPYGVAIGLAGLWLIGERAWS